MITKFAKNSEVKMIVEEKQISTNQYKKFLANKGVFSLVRSSKGLANQTYTIFLGSEDIEHLQGIMQTSNSYQKSSIIVVNPKEEYENLDEFIDDVNANIQEYKLMDSKYKIENIHKDSNGNLNIKMSYNKRLKGKTELIKTKLKEINISINPLKNDNKLAIDIRQNDNSDLKEIELFIKEINNLDKNKQLFEIEKITLDKLTDKNKIIFFDELMKLEYDNWTLIDIKGIDVKKSENHIIDNIEDEENGETVHQNELVGIKTAVFNGNSIRNTGLVKKFEQQGFYFTSVRLMYEFKKTTESFVIDINFKGTDDVKIDIIKNYERDEQDKDLIVVFPKDQQEQIINKFQKNVYHIYKEIIKRQGKLVTA